MGLDLGPWKDAVITIATSDVLSPEVDLGGEFENLIVIVPTITSSTVGVQVCRDSGGTFAALAKLLPAAVGHFVPVTTAGTASIEVVFSINFCRYIKIVCGSAQAANRTFQVRGFGLGG